MPHDQLRLDLARAAGEEGMRQVTERAEKNSPGVTDRMYAYLVKFAIATPRRTLFTAEDVSIAYAQDLCMAQPTDMRAWGPVFQKAGRRGVVEIVDHEGKRSLGHGVTGATRYRSRCYGRPMHTVEGIPAW